MAIGPFFLGIFLRKEVRNVKEKFVFEPSDIVNNELSKEEIEFWGHEAGEFFPEILEEICESSAEPRDESEKGKV